MQVVVQCLALTQEFRREDYSMIDQASGKLFGVANRNGGFYYDPSNFIYRAHGGNGRFDARSVEEVLLRVVVCGRGDDGEVSAFVGFAFIECCHEVQLAFTFGLLAQEALYLRIGNGAFAVIQQGNLFRHHIQSAHFIVLRQQHGQRKAHISHSCYGYTHALLFSWFGLLLPTKIVSSRKAKLNPIKLHLLGTNSRKEPTPLS